MSARRKIVLTVVVLLLIMAGAAAFGAWRILGGSAPEAVNLEDAVSAVQAQHEDQTVAGQSDDGPPETAGDAGDAGTESAETTDEQTTDSDAQRSDAGAAVTTAAASASETVEQGSGVDAGLEVMAGRWDLDAETGSFTFESATGSFVGFRVEEVLAGGIGDFTAVSRTGELSGLIEIVDGTVTATEITVDMTALRSNKSHRDHHVQEAMKTDSFPAGQFVLTEPFALDPSFGHGEAFSGSATGNLTLAGETRTVTFDISAQLVGEVIAVVGSAPVVFADFSVEAPESTAVISVEDNGIIEFQLFFRHTG